MKNTTGLSTKMSKINVRINKYKNAFSRSPKRINGVLLAMKNENKTACKRIFISSLRKIIIS